MQSRSELATRRRQAPAKPATKVLSDFSTYRKARSGWARATAPAASPDWLKFKNPEAPAVKREAEEDWGR